MQTVAKPAVLFGQIVKGRESRRSTSIGWLMAVGYLLFCVNNKQSPSSLLAHVRRVF